MKVISYMPLHYGKEYLYESISSFIDLVDKIYIFYTPFGSMGTRVNDECPDSEEELYDIALKAAGEKLIWKKVDVTSEQEHRKLIFKYAGKHDIVFTSDADEVWDTERLKEAMNESYNQDAKNIGIKGFINLWKSFDYQVVDQFRPIRMYNMRGTHVKMREVECPVWHFGYAQRMEIMRYKFKVHGHKEIASDYLERKYIPWTPENQIEYLHPASNDVWKQAESYDKTNMPELLKNHENYNKILI